jgi:hypothetical protein
MFLLTIKKFPYIVGGKVVKGAAGGAAKGAILGVIGGAIVSIIL